MKYEYIEVKGSDIHRHGVFAKKHIPKGKAIIEYVGRKISREEGDRIDAEAMARYIKDPEDNAGTYLFELDENHYLDGDVVENDAKYINHSCDPNCEVEITDDDRIWIHSLRDIMPGEEITFNYGFEIPKDKTYDFRHNPCRCGSKKCVGYILAEEEWPKLSELLKKEKEKNVISGSDKNHKVLK